MDFRVKLIDAMIDRVLATIVAGVLAAACCTDAAYPANSGPAAASALAARVLGPTASKLFTFHTLPASACEGGGAYGPCAVVESVGSTISIGGTTPVEMAYGLGQYCKTFLFMSFTWERSGGERRSTTAHTPCRLCPPLLLSYALDLYTP